MTFFGSALYSHVHYPLYMYANTIRLGSAKLSLKHIAVPHTSYIHHVHSWTLENVAGMAHNVWHSTQSSRPLYQKATQFPLQRQDNRVIFIQ